MTVTRATAITHIATATRGLPVFMAVLAATVVTVTRVVTTTRCPPPIEWIEQMFAHEFMMAPETPTNNP